MRSQYPRAPAGEKNGRVLVPFRRIGSETPCVRFCRTTNGTSMTFCTEINLFGFTGAESSCPIYQPRLYFDILVNRLREGLLRRPTNVGTNRPYLAVFALQVFSCSGLGGGDAFCFVLDHPSSSCASHLAAGSTVSLSLPMFAPACALPWQVVGRSMDILKFGGTISRANTSSWKPSPERARRHSTSA